MIKENNKYKKYYLWLALIMLFSLNSCSLDEHFDGNHWQETDRDDVNIIHKIWAQSFDKAQKIYIDSTTKAS